MGPESHPTMAWQSVNVEKHGRDLIPDALPPSGKHVKQFEDRHPSCYSGDSLKPQTHLKVEQIFDI